MWVNIIVGAFFFAIIAFALIGTLKSAKSNRCSGCSGGCYEEKSAKNIKEK